MGLKSEYELLIEWGYDQSSAAGITGYVPTSTTEGPVTVDRQEHVDRLKYNAWFDDQKEADRLEAEGDELGAEVLRSSVNDIDDMYEAVDIAGSINIRRTEKWGRLNVTADDLDDGQDVEEDHEPTVVTEGDVDALWEQLHPEGLENDDSDDDDVVAIGTDHVGSWGYERRRAG